MILYMCVDVCACVLAYLYGILILYACVPMIFITRVSASFAKNVVKVTNTSHVYEYSKCIVLNIYFNKNSRIE